MIKCKCGKLLTSDRYYMLHVDHYRQLGKVDNHNSKSIITPEEPVPEPPEVQAPPMVIPPPIDSEFVNIEDEVASVKRHLVSSTLRSAVGIIDQSFAGVKYPSAVIRAAISIIYKVNIDKAVIHNNETVTVSFASDAGEEVGDDVLDEEVLDESGEPAVKPAVKPSVKPAEPVKLSEPLKPTVEPHIKPVPVPINKPVPIPAVRPVVKPVDKSLIEVVGY